MNMRELLIARMPSRYLFVLALILVDFVFKIGTYTLLDHPVPAEWGLVRIHPILNKAGVAGFADMKMIEQESSVIFGLAVSIVLFSSVSFFLSRLSLTSLQFRIGVFLTGFVSLFLVKPFSALTPHQSLTAIEILHLCQISGAIGFAFAVYISRVPVFTSAMVLIFSGSVGNQLGFLYPPYDPIDFIEIRNVGILNLADLFIFTGFFLLIVGFFWFALRGVFTLLLKLWSCGHSLLGRMEKRKQEG